MKNTRGEAAIIYNFQYVLVFHSNLQVFQKIKNAYIEVLSSVHALSEPAGFLEIALSCSSALPALLPDKEYTKELIGSENERAS